MSSHYLKVGTFTPATDSIEATIDRELYGQGYIFKDTEAYETTLDCVCYVPELSDSAYTRRSFLELTDNQEAFARDLFDWVDWQHPETLLEEDYSSGEYADCPMCGRMFAAYEVITCPHCNEPIRNVWED
jgi:hypothetical protein